MKRSSLILLFLICASASAGAQSLDSIFRAYGDAYGGADRIKSIKTLKEEVHLKQNKLQMQIKHFIVYPDKHRIEVTVDSATNIYVVNGTVGMSIINGTVKQYDADKSNELKEQMRRFALIFDKEMFNTKRADRKTVLIGRDTLDTIPCWKIKTSDNSKNDRFLFLNDKTYLAVETLSRQFIGFDAYNEVRIYQKDLTKFGNIIAPKKLLAVAKGKLIMVQTLVSLEADVPIDDSLFDIGKRDK